MPEESETPQQRAARRQARATRAIEAIMSGGDLSAETQNLSNEFTDEATARLAKRFGRRRGVGREAERG